MNRRNANNPFCMIFGHNYFVEDQQSHSSKLRCKCCRKEFTLDDKGNLMDVAQNQLDSLFFS
ncbi:hypothetical protein V8G61_00995 [Gaetbulibacter sp. M240]|uniref:hypothetical protein n=1 Tax=Gaetbulibacter sp. M240 TaxID=3126511 RepID=UPI00374ED6E5